MNGGQSGQERCEAALARQGGGGARVRDKVNARRHCSRSLGATGADSMVGDVRARSFGVLSAAVDMVCAV